jgi:hypothetical protein
MTVVLKAKILFGEIFANSQLIIPGINANNPMINPPKKINNINNQYLLILRRLNMQTGNNTYIDDITKNIIGIKIMWRSVFIKSYICCKNLIL